MKRDLGDRLLDVFDAVPWPIRVPYGLLVVLPVLVVERIVKGPDGRGG